MNTEQRVISVIIEKTSTGFQLMQNKLTDWLQSGIIYPR